MKKEEKKSLSNEDFYNEDYYIIKTIKVHFYFKSAKKNSYSFTGKRSL